MDIVGWVALILIVAVLIFIVIIYQVYWLEKRNLALGFIFLTIGSGYSLIFGIRVLFNVYVAIANGSVSFSDFSNILIFIMSQAVGLFVTGLGIYGLISVYRNLRTVFDILKSTRKGS